MMVGTLLRRYHRIFHRMARKPQVRRLLHTAGCGLLGLVLSAASLKHTPQPFPLALLCAGLPGWLPIPFALGSGLGYLLFWGDAGMQGLLWVAAGLPVCVLLGNRQFPALVRPALAALITAGIGLLLQITRIRELSIPIYLLQVAMAALGCRLFAVVESRRDTAADWAAAAIGVLSLAQLAPLPFLDLGMLAAGVITAALPFPAVALSGLALDLAQITPVPMTAAVCLAFMLRLLPGKRALLQYLSPALAYLPVMLLCGEFDLTPLPALALGGLCGIFFPRQLPLSGRRGETGTAQVRLELASRVMAQTEQVLIETELSPIAEDLLVQRAADRACSTCPCRKNCQSIAHIKALPEATLQQPLADVDELPSSCRKRGRLLQELRHSQEHLKLLQADRSRQAEYKGALVQQYRFLAEFLQGLAEKLPKKAEPGRIRFQPESAIRTAGKELSNGDRCLRFAGSEGLYYLLLCDGMGTGLGAAEAAGFAAQTLRRLLMAGLPAEHALRHLNSLCSLQGRSGIVSIDLAELQLDSGKVTLYKWGAAPSYLLLPSGPERVGVPVAPPGLSAMECRETVDHVTLRKGEVLVLLSDGIDASAAISSVRRMPTDNIGLLASKLLAQGKGTGTDDATVAVIRLVADL